MAVKRYFSGYDDAGWEGGKPSRQAAADAPPEGTSSSTIVSGLVASRKQDQPVSLWQSTDLTTCVLPVYCTALCAHVSSTARNQKFT